MKRRDFIFTGLASGLSIGLVFFNPLRGFKHGSKAKRQVYKTGKIICLPASPEAYASDFHLDFEEEKVITSKNEMIHGKMNENLVLPPGSYTFQYLGDHYGWYVV